MLVVQLVAPFGIAVSPSVELQAFNTISHHTSYSRTGEKEKGRFGWRFQAAGAPKNNDWPEVNW